MEDIGEKSSCTSFTYKIRLEINMRTIFIIFTFFIMITTNILASDSIETTNFTNGTCFNYPNVTDNIGRNLSNYFCIIACDIPDTLEANRIKNDVQKAIEAAYPDHPELKGHIPYFHYIFTIEGHENLVFFGIPNPVDVHSGLHVVLNQSQNKYYVLPRITVRQLDSLLSTEDFFGLNADRDKLLYCLVISCFMNPGCPAKMIWSKDDLGMLLAMNNLDSLSSTWKYKDVVVEKPQIVLNGENTEITYYWAVWDNLDKIKIILNGSHLIDYREITIATINGLFGPPIY